jgi:hypothetical protein
MKQYYIYFIVRADTREVKIGFSHDVACRIKKLQHGNARPLTLLAMTRGDAEVEGAIHERFAHLRLTGEWFDMTDELVAFITKASSVSEYEMLAATEEGRIQRHWGWVLDGHGETGSE